MYEHISPLSDLGGDQKHVWEPIARAALEAGYLDTIEPCLRSARTSLFLTMTTCYIVSHMALCDVFTNRVAKERPGVMKTLLGLLECSSLLGFQGVTYALKTVCALGTRTHISSRVAVDLGLLPKLVSLLASPHAHQAARAIAGVVIESGNRAVAAVRAGAIPALARVVCEPASGSRSQEEKASAAKTLNVIARCLPADKLPSGAALEQCAAVLVWRLRRGGDDALGTAETLRLLARRTEYEIALVRAVAQAGAAVPLMQLARRGMGSRGSREEDAMLRWRALYLLGMVVARSGDAAQHDLVVRAGIIEIAAQVALEQQQEPRGRSEQSPQQEQQQKQQQQEQQQQEQQQMPDSCEQRDQVIKGAPTEDFAQVVLALFVALVFKEHGLAARVAATGVLPLLIRYVQSHPAHSDTHALRLIVWTMDVSEEEDYAWECLEGGAADIIERALYENADPDVQITAVSALMLLVPKLSPDAVPVLLPALEALVALGDSESAGPRHVAVQAVAEMVQWEDEWAAAVEDVGAVEVLLRAQEEEEEEEEGAHAEHLRQLMLEEPSDHTDGDSNSSSSIGNGDSAGSSILGSASGSKGSRGQMCSACGAGSKPNGKALMQCSACLEAWYCSATCQRKHWKVHKKKCDNWNGKR